MPERKAKPARECRTLNLDRGAVNVDERTVEMAFSSEEPVVRYWGIEILSHKKGAMNMSRMKSGCAVLVNHKADDQVGVVEKCTLDDDKTGRAVVRFSRSARGEEILQDIKDGIRRNVSVGYSIDEDVPMKPEEMDDEIKALALKEQAPVFLVTRWTPYEISVVPIPADTKVGVGRSDEAVETTAAPEAAPEIEITMRAEKPEKEKKMDEKERKAAEEAAQAERAKVVSESAHKERARVEEIFTLSSKHRVPAFVRDKAITEGTSIEEFRGIVLERIGDAVPLSTSAADLGLSKAEARRYSISRAILSLDPSQKIKAEFEDECSREIAKRLGRASKGMYVPIDAMRQAIDRTEQRDLTVGTNAAGGYLKGTDHLGSEFIDVLRNRMLARQLGARILTGLTGSVSIPKRTAGAVTYWVAESNAPTEGSNTFGVLSLAPNNIAANVDYTRNLLLQSNPSVDALVNGDLAIGIALGIDKAVFHGAGTDEPLGIDGTSGIGSVSGTTLGYAGMVEFQTDVAGSNALVENCAYVTTPAVAGLLMQRARFSNTDTPLWKGNVLTSEDVCGFKGRTSNQIATANMFFGDFSQIIIAEWGVLELVVDPYTQSKNGIIQVTAFQSVDVGVRVAGAFSLATSIT